MKQLAPRITVDEKVCFGKPVIEGTRITVEVVLGHLAAGTSVDDVARDYDLRREDILACLAYAARTVAADQIRAVS